MEREGASVELCVSVWMWVCLCVCLSISLPVCLCSAVYPRSPYHSTLVVSHQLQLVSCLVTTRWTAECLQCQLLNRQVEPIRNAVLLHMPCSVLLGIDQPPQCVKLYVYRYIVGKVGMGMGMQSPHMQPWAMSPLFPFH